MNQISVTTGPKPRGALDHLDVIETMPPELPLPLYSFGHFQRLYGCLACTLAVMHLSETNEEGRSDLLWECFVGWVK